MLFLTKYLIILAEFINSLLKYSKTLNNAFSDSSEVIEQDLRRRWMTRDDLLSGAPPSASLVSSNASIDGPSQESAMRKCRNYRGVNKYATAIEGSHELLLSSWTTSYPV